MTKSITSLFQPATYPQLTETRSQLLSQMFVLGETIPTPVVAMISALLTLKNHMGPTYSPVKENILMPLLVG